MGVRAIVFDIGGVLELGPDGREPMATFGPVLSGWERRIGVGPGKLGAIIAELYAAGACGTCSEREWWRRFGDRAGMPSADLSEFQTELWAHYLGELNGELADYFAALRPRFRTALLSNSFVGAREREEERHGFSRITDLIVYSHEEGLLKPDPRIYERTCERLAVAPSDVVFVDDRKEHVRGAREVGMTALLYRGNVALIAELDALGGAR
jgi:putative hydrolase of the HAD superfamily